MLLSEKDARAICHTVLSQVTAGDAEATVASSDQSHLRFAANAFATSGRREDVTVSLTVWVDKKKGTATTNEVDDASLEALVREAEQIASVSPVDREYLVHALSRAISRDLVPGGPEHNPPMLPT